MSQHHNRKKKNISFFGYHPTDVQEHLTAQQNHLALVETAIKQEEEAFNALYQQKLEYLEELDIMLTAALEQEKLLLKGRERT